MVARFTRHLSRDERALLSRRIAAGDFRDEGDFEEFALRRAVAEMHWRELRDLRKLRPPPDLSREEVVQRIRKMRRSGAKGHAP